MHNHASMRTDGAQFRGVPLNHSFDPLRTTFKPTKPKAFRHIVTDLLDAHRFRPEETIGVSALFDTDIGTISVCRGTLNSRYEWTSPLFTEYGHDGISGFREESGTLSAHGKVVVITHSEVMGYPRRTPYLDERIDAWRDSGVTAVLVFYNGDSMRSIGAWRSSLGGLCSVPQGIDSISFNILTRPALYLNYMHELDVKTANRMF